ncbi:UDP-2,4-diacetamido-2,4,6-trideoxy-beta-L-altropyranose hydrolase [Mesorhizobium newzealandense]|uniref:UDP-2,4-diacetamido-2,4, 6-trideoxy-beta-L-altropyranose hydrolase n=1 Tax=Mesorhizobium newzealandense TaxID=1300302 RepID=A0ABW4UCG0_9HYPH|nr:UDP-2,4-diacetamido-2,4,6-trideoxy-beta-L-altropyranose hydrolase [Mesorhizobium carmichaelinearum]
MSPRRLKRVQVAFRTDASIEIGTGHVMRCLTLADALRERGAECQFICRLHNGHLMDLIAERGYMAVALPKPPKEAIKTCAVPPHAYWLGTDWARDAQETCQAIAAVDCLIVDHYGLDRRWEEELRSACRHLMIIDDLADRPHNCDLLLDQSLGRTEQDYNGLLSAHAITLLGPDYALLRPEFAELRGESLARRLQPKLEHVLVTMGGVDRENVTGLVLDALDLCTSPSNLRITVVMGPHAPWLPQVRARALRMQRPTQVLTGVRDMARLMVGSDLAIGAAGSTTWERCSLGLPTIQIALADNQKEMAAVLAKRGAVIGTASKEDLSADLPNLLSILGTDQLKSLVSSSALVCAGGGAATVADHLLRLSLETLEGT